jgi:hypothetical protein
LDGQLKNKIKMEGVKNTEFVKDGNCCIWAKLDNSAYTPIFFNENNLNSDYILKTIADKFNVDVHDQSTYRLVAEEGELFAKNSFVRIEKIK